MHPDLQSSAGQNLRQHQQHQKHQKHQQHQQRHTEEEGGFARLVRAAEELIDSPPSHSVPFVAAVRQAGGLPLFGLPGYEADDFIASLVAGLLAGAEQAATAAPTPAAADTGVHHARKFAAAATATVAGPASTTTTDPIPPCLAPADPSVGVADAALSPTRRIVVASSDSDMLQLLAHPGCAWLELRQLSTATSAQDAPPLDVHTVPVPGIPSSLMLLHTGGGGDGSVGAAGGGSREGVEDGGRSASGAAAEAVATAAGGGAASSASGVPAAGSAMCPMEVATASGASMLLPPSRYPDYLALVGKAEAGVPGVGISRRTARKHVLRYGSVDGIVRAYELGALDASLRPVATAAAAVSAAASGGGSRRGHAVGVGGAFSPATDNGPGGGSRGDNGSGGNSIGSVSAYPSAHPPSVQQLLRNIAVTRMRQHPASVPWRRVLEYRRQLRPGGQPPEGKQARGRRPESEAQLDSSPGPRTGVSLGDGSCGQDPWAGFGFGAAVSPTLHPQDLLHLRSAAPFAACLAAVLRARGAACRTAHVDEQGGVADLLVAVGVASPTTTAGGGGGGGGAAGPLCVKGAASGDVAAGSVVVRAPRQPGWQPVEAVEVLSGGRPEQRQEEEQQRKEAQVQPQEEEQQQQQQLGQQPYGQQEPELRGGVAGCGQIGGRPFVAARSGGSGLEGACGNSCWQSILDGTAEGLGVSAEAVDAVVEALLRLAVEPAAAQPRGQQGAAGGGVGRQAVRTSGPEGTEAAPSGLPLPHSSGDDWGTWVLESAPPLSIRASTPVSAPGNVRAAGRDTQQPAAPMQQPAAALQQPAAPIQQLAAPLQQPAAPIQQPAAPNQKPTTRSQQPAAPPQQATATRPPLPGPLHVCVLGPWDFKDWRQLARGPPAGGPPAGGSPRQVQPGNDMCTGPSSASSLPSAPRAQEPLAAPTTPAPARPGQVPSGNPPAPGDKALWGMAQSLEAAVGPRKTLLHVPSVLQAALRSTTAWRLKRLQRSAGTLAVVPFYELLRLPPAQSAVSTAPERFLDLP